MFLPVTARALRRRRLDWPGQSIARATLFPMFDRGGGVHSVLVIAPTSSLIWLWRLPVSGWRVPWRGPVRFQEATLPRPIEPDDLPGVAALWHYDPWWLLRNEPFARHWATPALYRTNAVNCFAENARSVSFRRDLTRVAWVWVKSGGELRYRRWSAKMINPRPPGAEAEAVGSSSRGGS